MLSPIPSTLLSIALVCALAAPAVAQTVAPAAPPPQRPKIGLVLGGGGARGYAHIGVLEWLEEHHIPVDYIAGTSMGALIGGGYAMNVEPTDMRAIIGEIPWDEVFLEDVPYSARTFRRKEDAREYAVELQLGLKNGPSLPPGIFSAQPVNLLLDRLTLPYHEDEDIDRLPIPFRAVATDIESGEQVVMGGGSLGSAMRASMAIPGFFNPVRRDGRLLVDGMLVDNVPVDVVKEMGADIIIAVDVGTPLYEERQLGSALAISGQALSVMIINNTKRMLQIADIVIAPELGTFGTTDFSRVEEIADLGYKAAEAKGRFLEALAIDDAAWGSYVAARTGRGSGQEALPMSVAVVGGTDREHAAVRERFEPFAGKPLRTGDVEQQIQKLLGTSRYESVTYGVRQQNGEDELEIRLVPKSYAPPFVRFGTDVSNAQSTGADINANARATFFDVAGYGSEGRVDLGIGTRMFFSAELWRPVGESRYFVAPRLGIESRTEDLFVEDDRVARYRILESEIGLDLGYQTRDAELRVGYVLDYVDAETTIGSPLLPNISGFASIVRAQYIFDGQDRALLPTRGLRVESELRNVFDGPITGNNIPQFRTSISAFRPVNDRDTLVMRFLGGTTFGPGGSAPFDFALGGPLRLSAFKLNELRGDSMLYFSPGYLYRLGRLPEIIGGGLYAAGFYELGTAYDAFDDADWKHAGTAAFLMETKFGLVGLGASVGESGRSRFFFSLGSIVR